MIIQTITLSTTLFPTNLTTTDTIKTNCTAIHTTVVNDHLFSLEENKILNDNAPKIHSSERKLSRKMCCTLAQLRLGNSSFLLSYLNKINPQIYKSPLCLYCNSSPHNTQHLFNCPTFSTNLNVIDLWKSPVSVSDLLAR